jgi:hypothetical protein
MYVEGKFLHADRFPHEESVGQIVFSYQKNETRGIGRVARGRGG